MYGADHRLGRAPHGQHVMPRSRRTAGVPRRRRPAPPNKAGHGGRLRGRQAAAAVAAPACCPAPAPAAPAVQPTVVLEAAPSHGKVVLKADGSFAYTPAKDYTGSDSFTYKISTGAETISGTAAIVVR